MHYLMTLDMIRAYLHSLSPDEVCGETANANTCLVANAFHHRYGYGFTVGFDGTYRHSDGPFFAFPLHTEVQKVVEKFDDLGLLRNITRAEVERAFPELAAPPMYELTIETVKEYLATLGPDDIAGDEENAMDSTLARAYRFRYTAFVAVGLDALWITPESDDWGYLRPELKTLSRELFRKHGPITRAEVEALLPTRY